jgi:hypothetical protein
VCAGGGGGGVEGHGSRGAFWGKGRGGGLSESSGRGGRTVETVRGGDGDRGENGDQKPSECGCGEGGEAIMLYLHRVTLHQAALVVQSQSGE